MKDYFEKMGYALPAFFAVMAIMSLFILQSNILSPAVSDKLVFDRLFLVWGVLLSLGALLALARQKIGLHIFALGGFAESLMIGYANLFSAMPLGWGGIVVGIMPIIAYGLAMRKSAALR